MNTAKAKGAWGLMNKAVALCPPDALIAQPRMNHTV